MLPILQGDVLWGFQIKISVVKCHTSNPPVSFMGCLFHPMRTGTRVCRKISFPFAALAGIIEQQTLKEES